MKSFAVFFIHIAINGSSSIFSTPRLSGIARKHPGTEPRRMPRIRWLSLLTFRGLSGTGKLFRREENKLLLSIPGVEPVLASMFMAEIGNLSRFKSANQLVAFIGLSVVEWTSGSSVHKRPKINKHGRGRLRGCLYMAAMSAICCNPVIRKFYDRLCARGKIKMVALIAAMKKLIHIMFGVLKNRIALMPDYTMGGRMPA